MGNLRQRMADRVSEIRNSNRHVNFRILAEPLLPTAPVPGLLATTMCSGRLIIGLAAVFCLQVLDTFVS